MLSRAAIGIAVGILVLATSASAKLVQLPGKAGCVAQPTAPSAVKEECSVARLDRSSFSALAVSPITGICTWRPAARCPHFGSTAAICISPWQSRVCEWQWCIRLPPRDGSELRGRHDSESGRAQSVCVEPGMGGRCTSRRGKAPGTCLPVAAWQSSPGAGAEL
jgi:hypothetical protein